MRIILISIAAFVLAACAGSSDTTTTSAAPTANSAPAPTVTSTDLVVDDPPVETSLQDASLTDEDQDTSLTDEDIDSVRSARARSDVLVAVDADTEFPRSGQTATISVDISGVPETSLGSGLLQGPRVRIDFDPTEIEFVDLPEDCSAVSENQILCIVAVLSLGLTSGTATETETFDLVYQATPESTGSTTIEFEATSQDNPVSNDPDPTNNTTTIQLTRI